MWAQMVNYIRFFLLPACKRPGPGVNWWHLLTKVRQPESPNLQAGSQFSSAYLQLLTRAL